MREFLTFQSFISPTLLIILYYLGAVVIPFISFYISKWVKSRYLKDIDIKLDKVIPLKKRLLFLSVIVLCFLCMELFWRVMFEFFIAYFNMHDALMKLNLSN
jgi:Mn2+/Fe2+ NRAMP family transporter